MPAVQAEKPMHHKSQTLPTSSLVGQPVFGLASLPLSGSSNSPVSVGQLPHLIAQVGSRRVQQDAKWTEGPQLMASALGTELPVSLTETEAAEHPCENKSSRTLRSSRIVGQGSRSPVSVAELLRKLTTGRGRSGPHVYYLREVDQQAWRPYDLCVVPPTEAGPEHYIFSRSCVIHVTYSGYGGVISLAEWYRESVYWTALRKIPFFTNFKVRKAFFWWHLHVRRRGFLHRCQNLQDTILTDVPLYKNALLLLARVTEEVKGSHWLPQDESSCYRLVEFSDALQNQKQHFQLLLRKLAHYCCVVLNMVKAECLRSHHELCSHIGYSQQAKLYTGSIFQHVTHQRELRKDLRRAENTLNQFSSFVLLINHMTVQSLVSTLQLDASRFLHRVVQTHRSLFQTELTISAQQQLTVEPGPHLFLTVLREVLLTAKDFILKSCDTCGFFDETSSKDLVFSCASDLDFLKQALTNNSESTDSTADGKEFSCCQLAQHKLSQAQQQIPVWQQQLGTDGRALTLNRELLEWHLSMCDLSQSVEAAAAQFMEEGSDVERLCQSFSWLLDIQEYVGRWSPVLLGALKGQPAVVYEEHILMVRRWLTALLTVPSSLTSTNRLFNISCTSLKHKLEQQLQVIDEGLLNHLVEQVQLLSESLISELERAAADLQTTGQDFSEYAVKVRQWLCVWADMQKRLAYTRSLQEVISTNYREMNKEERARDGQMQNSWDHFLLLLKKAESVMCQDLPVHVRALDIMYLFVLHDLTELVSQLSHGPYLDPTQNALEMASRLRMLYAHVQTRQVRLEQLSRNSNNLQEVPKDLTRITREIKKIQGRKDLWEVLASCTTWMEECNTVLFNEMEVLQAKKQMEEWREKVLSGSSGIPPDDAVLQKTMYLLEHLSHQLEVLGQLKNPALKHKHWPDILRGIGLTHVQPQELTVGHLLSLQPEQHHDFLSKICYNAKAECNMESDFQHLQKQWAGNILQLENFCATFTEPQGGHQTCGEHTQTITDLEVHLAQTKFDLVILSNMMKSPFSVDFRSQLEDWLQLIQKLDDLLHLFKRFQQMWTFLTKVFNSSFISVHQTDLLQQFQPVDKSFQEVIHHISSDPHVLRLVCASNPTEVLHGENLCQILTAGLATMEVISTQLVELLDSLCSQCPRLRFLSDREVMLIFSSQPTPSAMLPFVRRLFKGVRELEAGALQTCVANSNSQVKVWGILGSLQERVTFLSPVEPRISAMVWLCDFDKQLHLAMVEHMKECALVKEQLEPPEQVLSADRRVGDTVLSNDLMKQCLNVLGLLTKHPTQCLLVAEEAVWCKVVEETFPHPVKVSNLKFYLKARLAVLGHFIRDGVVLERSHGVTAGHASLFLRALVQMTVNHSENLSQLQRAQGQLHSSFEWLSLLRYNLSVENSQGSLCFVDVLGQRLQYGYEYVGSADWIILHTPSTDRAKLGILLAVTNFRCGFVNGPCKTGKKNLVVQLAMALGRMVFVLECGLSVKRVTLENFLLGSLQIGAWLLLDSVDLLAPTVSAALGQLFIDIHESFSKMTKESKQCRTDDRGRGCQFHLNALCSVGVANRKVSASFNYGCVLLSSKGHMCDVPDDLQTATRAVALTHPDYKVIAEFMLTSLGFVDAKFLSQRLVSLITLSKDCLCLPGWNTENKSLFLPILQNIISSSELYLEQCRRQRATPEERESTQDKGGHFMRPSVFSVVRSVMEEAAVVKSILSVMVPFTCEQNKASEFHQLLKDTFPMVCQFPSLEHYLEEHEKIQVKAAISQVLQGNSFQPETEILNNALTVYQSIKCGKAVILSGPSGSGKTSCYSVLAEALNKLAVKSEKHERHTKTAELKVEATRSLVEPVVLFPNSMSHEEMFGHYCEQRGWQDGALTKTLRDSALTCGHAERVEYWLVLDGEPAGEPGWMDFLATLCHPTEPYLCLASGEHIIPSQAQLQIFIEVTDLSAASPSTLTACSLVTFTGTELWKAVWRSQMHYLCSKHHFDQTILEMWQFLAEDLFSATLCLLSQNCMSSANYSESDSSRSPPHGLQEIMSFFRILNALIQHFEVCLNVHTCEDGEEPVSKGVSLPGSNTMCSSSKNKAKMLARNCFLVAYSWGFGGHLHPSVCPRFQLVAHEVLLKCRYRIQVPEGESVFEYFFTSDRHVCLQTTVLTSHITPKYGVYTHLLNIMLEAKQSVLLTGEPGSGKSTLCRSLPSFNKPYVSLSGSAVLSPAHLYSVFGRCSASKPSHMLLFVDDLHEAPCDGKTPKVLEALRQSISKGGIVMLSNNTLQSLSTAAITYMATSCVLGPAHSLALSHRLTRLFSIFVLPSLSRNVILSLYSARLQLWMCPFVQNTPEIASCIISATHSLYLALCDHFRHTVDQPSVLFSIHDLQKVFQGMTLWQCDNSSTQKENTGLSNGPTAILNIVKLWLHECMHTFTDRVCEEDQHLALERLMADIATIHFGSLLNPQECSEASSQPDSCSPEPGLTADSLHDLIWQCIRDIKSYTVYSPEVSVLLNAGEKRGISRQTSYKEYSLDFLTEQLSNHLNEHQLYQEYHNTTSGFTHKYTVHRQAVRQLVHIFRVLLIPGAHAALIGSDTGTGRKTTVRCAALLTGCELLEVHSANEKELHEILRDAGSQTRVEGVQVMVLVHEDVSLAVREQLLVAMAQTYPGLCTQDQLSQHISTVTSSSLSKRYLLDHWMLDKHLGQIHNNIHIFLLLPRSSTTLGTKSSSKWNTQMRKALSRCCCVEVYRAWSHESLVAAAGFCLQTSCPDSPEVKKSVSSVSEAMAHIHLSACQYASTLLTHQHFSPSTYLKFIAHFCDLSKLLQRQGLQQANRVEAVVSGLDVMTSTALETLLRQREKAERIKQEEEAMLRSITTQEQLLQDAQHTCVLEEARLCELEQDIQQTQLKVKAVFEAGVRKVTSLTVTDLEEVRGYRNPPEAVVMVLDALCLLFQRPPGWDSAKHLLSQANFFQELEYFDHYILSKQRLHQLGLLVGSPLFEPGLVREASKACESLCHWVLAVYQCCCMQQYLEVNQQLEAKAAAARDRLQLARIQKEEARSCLTKLQHQLHSVREQLEKQRFMLQEAEHIQKETASTVGKLGRYVALWKDDAQKAAEMFEALPADALITAAIISYLGPFGPDIRSELLSKWTELCKTGRIHSVPEDPRSSLFAQSPSAPCGPCNGFPLPMSAPLQQTLTRALGLRARQLQGVGLSSLLVHLLLWSCTEDCLQHCPLLADPHYRLESNSPSSCIIGQNTKAMKEYGMEVCGDDHELLNKLEQAAVTGVRVLVKHAERAPPCPRLLSMLSHPGCVWPGAKQALQPPHPNFCLVFSTHLPVHLLTSEMHPSLLTKLRVVDLSLGSEEMESFMLTQLLHPECSELLSRRLQLQHNKQSLAEALCTQEDSVMDYIVQCKGPLLEEPGFVHEVRGFHEETEKLHSELEQMDEALRWCERVLDPSRPLFALSSVVYRALQQVAVLSPAYFFSLDRFLAVVKVALSGKAAELVSHPTVPWAIVEELTNQLVSHVLLYYRPCLLKSHAAVLRLLLCVALIQHKQLCSQAESQAFLRGLLKSQQDLMSAEACPALPDWIPSHVHPELLCLEQVPAFSGLLSSLSSCPEQWQEYLSVPSSATGLVPFGPFGQLSLLQRALLWKTLMPQSLQHLAEGMAACHLREPAKPGTEAPRTGNPQVLSQLLLQHRRPVIIVSCADEPKGIQPLQLIKQLAHCVQVQVKVIGFEHSWESASIVSTLESALKDGLWVVFKNCHLLEQWDNQVMIEINRLTLSLKGSLDKPGGTRFQLWFITQEDQLHFIPLAVRMRALLFMCDSCWNLKEELNSSLQQIAFTNQAKSLSRPSGANTQALFRCAIFHSVLLQRQAYIGSGQGDCCHWSETDLMTLVEAYSHTATLCSDQMGALQYVAVNLVHGGQVLDSADLEEVRSVARIYLSTEPDSLSSLCSYYHHHDVSALLEVLNGSERDWTDRQERLLLGFGPDISTEMLQKNSHNLNILLQASQCPLGHSEHFCSEGDQPADGALRQRLWALKVYLSDRTGAPGAAPSGPLQDFLLSEWDQLLALVSSLVSESQPADLSKLSELHHLERRAQLLSAYLWHHDSADPAKAYRLSAFKNPRGFLVALRRESARIYHQNICDMALHFQVLGERENLPPPSAEAVYLCGLELRGAAWDSERGVIQDILSAAPSPVPLICVSAGVGSTDHMPHKLYQCPLYVEPAGLSSLRLGQHDAVTSVPLQSGPEPELCALRRVRLISRL